MPYTYILDDSIKSPTLILAADHSTLLFLPGFFLMIRRPPRSTPLYSSAASDVYKRQPIPAMGVKFSNPPLDLGLKYHDPPPLL